MQKCGVCTLLPAGCRKSANWCLLTSQKFVFSLRRGDSLHRFTWNFARPRGPLCHTKIHANRSMWVGTGSPKYQNFRLFTGKLPLLNLVTGQKSPFSTRRSVQNFAPIGARGGKAAPKSWKFPHFGKELPPEANRLTDFYSCWGFYTPNSPVLVFYIWRD